MHASRIAVVICVLPLVASLFLFTSMPASAESRYSVADIGTVVGTGDGQFDELVNTRGSSLNQAGDIVAVAETANAGEWSVAFTNIDGKVRRLGKEKLQSAALDINDSGEIVGWVTDFDDLLLDQTTAVVWRDRDMVELPGLGGFQGVADAINNQGDIVGSASLSGGQSHAVLWHDDAATELPSLDGYLAEGLDISDSGQIVGWSITQNDCGISCPMHPVIWTSGAIEELPVPTDGWDGQANSINEDGVIVGESMDSAVFPRVPNAVIWRDKEPDTLPSFQDGASASALDVNSSGQIVGEAQPGVDASEPVAVLWDGDQITDLNTLLPADSGFELRSAVSINDAVQILATAAQGETLVGVLLQPVEPSALRLGGADFGLAVAARREDL